MLRNLILVTFAGMVSSGCSMLLNQSDDQALVEDLNRHPTEHLFNLSDCKGIGRSEKTCSVEYWIHWWIDINPLSWKQRKQFISELGSTTTDKFKKILLSQGPGTPFQDRLRAQIWIDEILPALPDGLNSMIRQLVYRPSQELLEFESALSTLSRVNAQQAETIEEQSTTLQKQQQKIKTFLEIEASMVEKQEGEPNE